jgi:hypothetical protein
VIDLILDMLNSFSIDPKNECYQQRRSEDDNEEVPIFFSHGITGGAILLNTKFLHNGGRSKFTA